VTDFDPTTNRISFEMLVFEERKALLEWPHGWEFCSPGFDSWKECHDPTWARATVYRGKPAPVVVSWYRNIEPQHGEFRSRHFADLTASPSRIAVLRIDICNGVSTAHLEEVK
jgi:hypothetical protein